MGQTQKNRPSVHLTNASFLRFNSCSIESLALEFSMKEIVVKPWPT